MVCGTVPFKAQTMPELNKIILRGSFKLPETLSLPVRDLIKRMLNLIPQNRITIPEILSHPWLKKDAS
jgi:serine/threonine protein kinase